MGYEANSWRQTLFSVSSFSLFINAGGGAKVSFQALTMPPYQRQARWRAVLPNSWKTEKARKCP